MTLTREQLYMLGQAKAHLIIACEALRMALLQCGLAKPNSEPLALIAVTLAHADVALTAAYRAVDGELT